MEFHVWYRMQGYGFLLLSANAYDTLWHRHTPGPTLQACNRKQ